MEFSSFWHRQMYFVRKCNTLVCSDMHEIKLIYIHIYNIHAQKVDIHTHKHVRRYLYNCLACINNRLITCDMQDVKTVSECTDIHHVHHETKLIYMNMFEGDISIIAWLALIIDWLPAICKMWKLYQNALIFIMYITKQSWYTWTCSKEISL